MKINIILLALLVFGCQDIRKNEGEDLHHTNEDEVKVIKDKITYIKDYRTGLCFAVLNNHTDGFRSTFIITCVPCDSLKRVNIK